MESYVLRFLTMPFGLVNPFFPWSIVRPLTFFCSNMPTVYLAAQRHAADVRPSHPGGAYAWRQHRLRYGFHAQYRAWHGNGGCALLLLQGVVSNGFLAARTPQDFPRMVPNGLPVPKQRKRRCLGTGSPLLRNDNAVAA